MSWDANVKLAMVFIFIVPRLLRRLGRGIGPRLGYEMSRYTRVSRKFARPLAAWCREGRHDDETP